MATEDVKHYGLAQWHWDGEGHVPPEGATSVIDYRPLEDQATAGQSQGYGFFHWSTARPVGAVDLGSGDCRTLQPTQQQRTELRTRLGLSADPGGVTLIETMEDALAKAGIPIMPGRSGEEEIHLSGHSKVWSRKVVPGEILAASPKGKANRQRDVIRAAIDEAERAGGKRLAQKVLAAWLLKLGYSREEVREGAAGKAAEWRRLVSAATRAKHGDMRPERPTTSFAESWPNVTSDIEATAQDQAWTTLAIEGMADTIKVVSGNEIEPSSGFSGKWGVCASAVSSSDHLVEAVARAASGWAGVVARASASSVTGYAAALLNDLRRLYKFVAGVRTQLLAPSGGGRDLMLGCDADGSTITHQLAGYGDESVTDTAIASGLRGAVWLYSDGSTSFTQVGAWSIDDGLSAAKPWLYARQPARIIGV